MFYCSSFFIASREFLSVENAIMLYNKTKARFIRVVPCRIRFNDVGIEFERKSTFKSAAAFLPHVRLVLLHYPTEMRHRYSNVSFLACRMSYTHHVNV